MAEFKFNCPQCGQKIEANESFRGQVAECPHCGKGIVVPSGTKKLPMAHRKFSKPTPVVPQAIAHAQTTQVNCPYCGASYEVKYSEFGNMAKCEVCGKSFFIGMMLPKTGFWWRVKRNFSTVGRSTRKEFWIITLIVCLLSTPIFIFVPTLGFKMAAMGSMCVWIRRLHDLNRSGYWLIVLLGGMVVCMAANRFSLNFLEVFVWLCWAATLGTLDGMPDDNDYGSVPQKRARTEVQPKIARMALLLLICGTVVCSMLTIGVGHSRKPPQGYGPVAEIARSRRLADQGDAQAQFDIGIYYAKGLGGAKDDWEAAKWYRKAAEQGHADAQSNLGDCYDEGKGVEQNHSEAVKWYRKAACQGHAGAQFNLGDYYAKGKGGAADDWEATKWYSKAAEQGHVAAQYNLGVCYAKGKGVEEKDDTKAVKWYRKAAEQGLAEAQYELGACYAKGEGLEKNEVEALKWYRKAARQGHNDAQKQVAHYDSIRRQETSNKENENQSCNVSGKKVASKPKKEPAVTDDLIGILCLVGFLGAIGWVIEKLFQGRDENVASSGEKVIIVKKEGGCGCGLIIIIALGIVLGGLLLCSF